eukprot:m.40208 g.40208  ORF g.40208 m.40208 type:complete len:57 (-) comp10407_c0_seq3:309-479(-)
MCCLTRLHRFISQTDEPCDSVLENHGLSFGSAMTGSQRFRVKLKPNQVWIISAKAG